MNRSTLQKCVSFFTGVVLLFGLTGCGDWGTRHSIISAQYPQEIRLSGGILPTKYIALNINNIDVNMPLVRILGAQYGIDGNWGGDGTVGLAKLPAGGDCSTATPTEVITITAGIVTTTDVPLLPQTVAILEDAVFTLGTMRICGIITQADVNNPVDIHLRVVTTVEREYRGPLITS